MADFSWDEYRYRVLSTTLVTPVIRELRLGPTAESLPYRAGQYVLLSDPQRRVPQRSYSVANAPAADGHVTILVTAVPGGPTSTWAHGLTVGEDVLLEGPYGTFVLSPRFDGPVLLLGAGSGLAPVRAIAEDLVLRESGPSRPATLYFSGRTESDAIGREQFEEWARRWERFDYRLTCTRQPSAPRHLRVPELLPQDYETLSGTAVFTAGPPGFVTGCHAAALALGAAPSDIFTEEFFTDPAPWTDAIPQLPVHRSIPSHTPED